MNVADYPAWLYPREIPTGDARDVSLLGKEAPIVIAECIRQAHQKNREAYEKRVAAPGLTAEEYTAQRRREKARKRAAARRAKKAAQYVEKRRAQRTEFWSAKT